MRIIIETDANNQPNVQVGASGTDTAVPPQGVNSTGGNAIDAGPPKVNLGGNSTPLPLSDNATPAQGSSDLTSAGSAPSVTA